MTVGFEVDILWYEVGTEDFLNSFFSTVKYHLCTNLVSDKYPHLLNDLYHGKVKYEDALATIKEVEAIRLSLKDFKPKEVIWDIEDLSKSPPWGDAISEDIKDLSNYFITSDGEDLFDSLINDALRNSYEEKVDLKIVNL
jgi:2,3-bisphosphoglycerate-dependent phosphoglycerate mutase